MNLRRSPGLCSTGTAVDTERPTPPAPSIGEPPCLVLACLGLASSLWSAGALRLMWFRRVALHTCCLLGRNETTQGFHTVSRCLRNGGLTFLRLCCVLGLRRWPFRTPAFCRHAAYAGRRHCAHRLERRHHQVRPSLDPSLSQCRVIGLYPS